MLSCLTQHVKLAAGLTLGLLGGVGVLSSSRSLDDWTLASVWLGRAF